MGYAIPTFPTTFSGTGGGSGGGACTVNNYITCGAGTGGGGSGPAGFANWVRYNALGAKLAGTGITPLRTAVGTTKLTADAAFLEAGGFSQYGVLATVSAAAGSGGEGITPFKKYDSNSPQLTGQTAAEDFFLSRATNKIYVLCPSDGKIWIHDLANWTAAATTITPGSTIRAAGQSGCMSTDGLRIYLSGDSGYPIRVLNTVTGVVTVLGTNLDAICIAADSSGNLYTYEGGITKKYTPNVGTGSLGIAVATWSVNLLNSATNNQVAFDHNGFLWGQSGDSIYSLNPGGSVSTRHRYPIPPTGIGISARIQADHLNQCLYVSVTDVSSKGYVYRYSGWIDSAEDSGFWKPIITLSGGGIFTGTWYDPESGILIAKDAAGTNTIRRFLANAEIPLDAVSVKDTTGPDNPQVDYNLTNSRHLLYLDEYAYDLETKASTVYLNRISYKGPALGSAGSGGFVASILNWAYEIINSSEAYLYTFRQGTPNQMVDAEVTACFTSDAVAGGGTPDPGEQDLHQFVMPFAFGDSTPALIGTMAAGKAIFSAQIFISTPFNGTGAALSIGTTTAPEDLMAVLENNPALDGEYSVYTEKTYGPATPLYLHIVPGSSASAGAGIVIIEFQP